MFCETVYKNLFLKSDSKTRLRFLKFNKHFILEEKVQSLHKTPKLYLKIKL